MGRAFFKKIFFRSVLFAQIPWHVRVNLYISFLFKGFKLCQVVAVLALLVFWDFFFFWCFVVLGFFFLFFITVSMINNTFPLILPGNAQ